MESASLAAPDMIRGARQEFSFGRWSILSACCTLLVFAPLAYASVHTWAYFSLGLATVALSLSLLAKGLYDLKALSDRKVFLPSPPLWGAALAVPLLVFIQVTPYPQWAIAWVSPVAWQIRSWGNGYGLADYLPLSLDPYATLLESLKFWPAIVLFYVLLYTINSRRQLNVLIGVILGVAFFEVLYGFWDFHHHLIWGWQPYKHGTQRLMGTFINSNHLAMYLVMAILLAFGIFLSQSEALRRSTAPGHQPRRLSKPVLIESHLRLALFLLFPLSLTVALIFTYSRAALISLVMGFAMMILLTRGKRWGIGNILTVVIFLFISLLYSYFLGSGKALTRFFDQSDPLRYYAFKGALTTWSEFPWFGSGIGTFGELFYRYKPAELNESYLIYAHSDWLQLLAETGIVGFSLVAGVCCVFFSIIVKQWRRRRDSYARGVGLGCLAAMSAALFHAAVEFPFHIPACGYLFATIAAIAYLAVHHHDNGVQYFSYPVIKFSGQRRKWTVVLLGLMVLQLIFVVGVYRYWGGEWAAPLEINSTRPVPHLGAENFRRALTYNPQNSKYYLGLAESLEKQEAREGAPLREVEELFKAAVFHSPGYWEHHLMLGEFYLRQFQRTSVSKTITKTLQEMNAAVKLFPESGTLHLRLALVLDWADKYYVKLVPPELRGQANFHFKRAVELDRTLEKLVPAS